MLFANIIVDITHEKLDKTFQYIIPAGIEEKIYAGVLVYIPFGKGNRKITGYVIEVTDRAEYDIDKMKYIIDTVDKSVPIETTLIKLAGYIKENYGSTMNQALKTVIPVKVQKKSIENKTIILNIDEKEQEEYRLSFTKKHAVARLRLLNELILHKRLSYSLVTEKLNVTAKTIGEMEKLGILRIEREKFYRTPIKNSFKTGYDIVLNDTQRRVAEAIEKSTETVHLIRGITGSGKTEVYMELIANVLREGKEAIVLIPEIALTYQTVMRFYKRFGDAVSIVNSKLSAGEKYDQFEMAKEGRVKIMIGPRSAVFTPFRRLGLIIIDEEHEGTYKSEAVPKYHAREVAIYRAREEGAKVVLGSATPSVDSYYRAEKGEYMLYSMTQRAKEAKLPQVTVADMRVELEKGNKTMFSEKLNGLITDRLKKGEQIILFINRRGFAGFVSCRSCGEAMKCPHCDVGLTLHTDRNWGMYNNSGGAGQNKLVCHYCGYTIPMPKNCPNCQSKYIAAFGIGTQKVEEAVHKLYPAARVLRMDMDTTSQKNGHEKILSAFANGEADVLIGTQMIVKGHDFPNVTLVGVIAADLSLYASDYRASERTFQLLTQAAGRAGRGDKEGEVVIQTYAPENPAIISSSRQDYEEFYNREKLYRTLMEYPPVYHMMAILMTSRDKEQLDEFSEWIKESIEGYQEENIDKAERLRLIGPADAGISKINDVYRKVYYIKSENYNRLTHIKDFVENILLYEEKYKNVTIQYDFNPMSGY